MGSTVLSRLGSTAEYGITLGGRVVELPVGHVAVCIKCERGADRRLVLPLGAHPPPAGIGTRWMAGEFPASQVTAIDLSPYMLAVAELRERQLEAAGKLGSRK